MRAPRLSCVRGSAETILLVVAVAMALLLAVTVFGQRLAQRQAAAVAALDRGSALDGPGGADPSGPSLTPPTDGAAGGSGAGGPGPRTEPGGGAGSGGGIGLPPGANAGGRSPMDGGEMTPRAPAGKGGAGGSGAPGGAGGDAASGGGGPAGAQPPADATPGDDPAEAAATGPGAAVDAILRERARRQRENAEAAKKHQTRHDANALKYVDDTRDAVAGSAAYAALDPADQKLLEELWNAFRFYEDETTARAALNLARLLEEGKLAGPQGHAVLQALADKVRKDGGKAGPHSVEAILIAANRQRLDNLRSYGRLPAYTRDGVLLEGKKVAEEVRGTLRSNNYPWHFGDYLFGSEGVNGLRTNVLEQIRADAPPQGANTPDAVTIGADTINKAGSYALALGWGNCQECAAAAAKLLHERGVGGVEVFRRAGDPARTHAFVVVGRDPNSDPKDPSTWGPNAVIVDAWDGGKAYPAAGKKASDIPGDGDLEVSIRLPDPVGAPGLKNGR